jgi:putative glutamine amidotransferase
MKKIWILCFTQEHKHWLSYRLSPDYAKMIESLGMLPVMIPYHTLHMEYFIQECDGFIIPWGRDVSPECYSESLNGAKSCSVEHDLIALDFIKQVQKSKKTLFGICRGMQLLNVYFWGTLIQHLESSEIHNQLSSPQKLIHKVDITSQSFLSQVFWKDSIPVNSIHHQAVKSLGFWLKAVAFDEKDRIIEAIEHQELPFFWVQWHPEKLTQHQILFKHIFS